MSHISLIGLPNSGKSSLFNTFTNTKQRVANYPGITVEKKTGNFKFHDSLYEIVDLPGIYTLDVSTLDEKVTRDYIFGKNDSILLLISLMNTPPNFITNPYIASCSDASSSPMIKMSACPKIWVLNSIMLSA